ncbi:MAG: DUF4981 domain-containing protein [Ruminococcus sp.]|nr:DUF4981 domain-containing protein [Ruminococcus sp.]
MKKKSILFVSALMLTQSLNGFAPQTASAADVTFTHKEWSGQSGAEDVFAVNREAASCNPVPFQDDASAVNAVWNYNDREKSDYLQMLTGENEDWELTVVQNDDEAAPYRWGGFMNADYQGKEGDGWKTVQLPKSWTALGFDHSIYTNIGEPWQSDYDPWVTCPLAPTKYNPVGLYRKKFTLDSAMRQSGRRVYIQLDGVESAYYVYINGKQVGYSEDSFSPHRFDITDYLTDGENILAVEVHKFCDGTWFEDQDMIYDGGIFRDVFLVSAPDVQISDYTVCTDLDNSYENAWLNLCIDVRNLTGIARNGWTLEAAAFDEAGNNILGDAYTSVDALGAGKTGTYSIITFVTSPKLWSAETPNIYALVLTLKDENGNVKEKVSTQLGFREIGFTPTAVDGGYNVTTQQWKPITINGKRLLLKGVNRHDSDPFYGKAVPQETMEEDVRLMQKYNINAIRTSHYSNDSYLYWFCNKYGMYMMGETNMECHALQDGKNNDTKALFYELAMDRTETAYKRLKNNPAIVSWSIGNEMGYTGNPNDAGGMFRDMIWYFKRNDPFRPVHSEGQHFGMGVDMGSDMYPGSDVIRYNAGDGKMPYVMCEYDHAMGNSVGALKEYWDVIRSSDNMLGGFIWDWVDQSRAVSLPYGGWDYYSESYAHKNLYSDKSRGKFFGYGGDWGDKPNDNSFCENGIVCPDRTPQPEADEVRYQYQSFWFSANAGQLANNTVSVYNENNFLDLSDFTVEWKLLKNGTAIDGGTIKNAECAPLTRANLTVPFKLPKNYLSGDEFILDISVKTKKSTDLLPSGTEVAYEQIALDSAGSSAKYDGGDAVLTIVDAGNVYVPTNNHNEFNFAISKSTGLMEKYSYKGSMLIQNGPTPNFWRGNVENDTGWGAKNLYDKAWENAMQGAKVTGMETGDAADGAKTVTSHLELPNAGGTKVDIVYTIYPDGRVNVNFNVDAAKSGLGNFLRVGSMMTLPEGSEQLAWYGNKTESFNDRKTGGRQGIWESTVSEQYFPYLKADDCGNLTDVKWIAVKNKANNTSLLIAANGTVEASALHFYPEDLQKADHVFKLSPRKETILSVDYGSMGTGSATCGQGTLEKYRLPSSRTYSWSYTIIPVDTDSDSKALSATAAQLRSDGVSIQDKSSNALTIPVKAPASLKTTADGNAVSGSLSIPSSNSIGSSLEGKHSFTVEAEFVPTGEPQFNMIASKGDHAFGLRTEKGMLYFFVHAGGAWRTVSYNRDTDASSGWLGKKHQMAGIYDADTDTIKLYCDGKILAEKSTGTTAGVTSSSYDLTLGACPETGRSSMADFYEFRVYSKALTESELASQNTSSPAYAPDSRYVQLWLDFDNVVTPALPNPTVSYEAGEGAVKLDWTKVTGAEKYGIAVYESGGWKNVAECSDTSYTLKNLKAGTNYKVAVIAKVNGAWNRDFSNAITVTPKTSNENRYPVVTAEVSGRQFRLKWTSVSGAEKYGIALYQNGKWRVKAQFAKNVTTFTSPKMKTGSYRMVVCAKVNGEWDTSSLSKRAVTVKIV